MTNIRYGHGWHRWKYWQSFKSFKSFSNLENINYLVIGWLFNMDPREKDKTPDCDSKVCFVMEGKIIKDDHCFVTNHTQKKVQHSRPVPQVLIGSSGQFPVKVCCPSPHRAIFCFCRLLHTGIECEFWLTRKELMTQRAHGRALDTEAFSFSSFSFGNGVNNTFVDNDLVRLYLRH